MRKTKRKKIENRSGEMSRRKCVRSSVSQSAVAENDESGEKIRRDA